MEVSRAGRRRNNDYGESKKRSAKVKRFEEYSRKLEHRESQDVSRAYK